MKAVFENHGVNTIAALCTKAGNSPYNKGGTITQIETDRIISRYSYKGANLVILRPIIDKLVFDYKLQDVGKNRKAIEATIDENILKLIAVKSEQFSFRKTTLDNVGLANHTLHKTYKSNFLLRYKPTGAKVIIQIKPKQQGGYIRFVLNPSRLGPKGILFLDAFIGLLTANDFKEISFKTIAALPKAIKRIDIAVDMLGVDASDLEGRYVYKQKKLKGHSFQNETGRKESQYFLMSEHDKNQAYWYNKRKEIKDKTDDPTSAGVQPLYGKALITRFEYRINETDKPISNLKSLTNHLTKFKFRAVD